MTTTMTTVISRPNPYVGPRPYRQGETIYGRERETSELLDILIAERIVLFYSPSGAGKSSLLNAAILPKMAEQGFQVFPVMRANMEPPTNIELGSDFNRYVYSCLQSIEEGLPEDQRFSMEELSKLKFKQYLAKYRERAKAQNPDLDSGAPILLILDQAEEVIRISMMDRQKKLDFFIQFGEVLRDRGIWALVSMREDYLASLDPYLRPIPTRFVNRYRLNFLDADAASKAIQHPAQNAGVEFPDDAAHQLVDDLRAILVQQPDGSTTQELGPTVEPVQLQVVCRRLWTNLPNADTSVTLEQVKALGNVNRALADYYALQTASIANMAHVPEREIREWFQRKLITVSGIRGQVLMTPERSEGLANEAIWMLERAYLIRAEKRGGATWFELSHDRMVRPIIENNAEWFEKHLNVVQRRADLWNQQGRPESMLLIDDEFVEMDQWVKSGPKVITPVEKDFYRESLKARQHAVRERTTNILIRWLFVASVISTIVAIGFYFRAHAAEQNALARELAAASLSNLNTDPERSLLLALEGWNVTTEPHQEIIQALHQTLPEVRIVDASEPQDRHLSNVYTVSYSPDGKFLASASKDGTIIIWDAKDLAVVQTLTPIPDPGQFNGFGVFAATYSPDGKTLASVGADGKLTVWDTSTWETLYVINAHKRQARAVAYSHDGRYIATGGGDSMARIWNAANGEKVRDLGGQKGNQHGIEAVIFSLDDSILFVGGDNDKTIYAWDARASELAYQFSGPGPSENTINGLAVSPNGKWLASSGVDRMIRLWNIETRAFEMEIPGHADWVYGLAFTIDGKNLISASADRTIRIWDTTYGRSMAVLTGPSNQVFGVAVSPDGRYMASASGDYYVRLWDISPRGSYEVITLDHQDEVNDVLVSPDGKMIASAGHDGVINLWNISTGDLIRKLRTNSSSPVDVLYWSLGGRYLAAGYSNGQAVIWDMENTAENAKPVITIRGDGPPLKGLSLNADSSLLATGDHAGIAHIYETANGKEIARLDADKKFDWLSSGKYSPSDVWLSSTVFSPDGKYLAAGYGTGLIVIWEWKSGEVWMTLENHDDIVENVVYNTDGSLLTSAGDDGKVILWNIDPELRTYTSTAFEGHRALVYDAVFSPDGLLIASGGGDGLVKIWDAATGKQIMDLYGNEHGIKSVVFSKDGRYVISGSDDHTIRIYTMDRQELYDLAEERLTRVLSEIECEEYLGKGCQEFKNSDPLKPISDILHHLFGW